MALVLIRVSRELADAVRLLLYRDVRKTFWSEGWIDLGALLSALSDRLARQAAVHHVDVNDGWWEDRDLTIVVRGGPRLDVQTLIEEHDGGRCVCRFRIRSRMLIAPMALLFGALSVTLWSGGRALGWGLAAIAAGLTLAGALLTSIAIATAFGEAAAATGMCALGSRVGAGGAGRAWSDSSPIAGK